MAQKNININTFRFVIILITAITILSISGYFSYTSYNKNISSSKDIELNKLKSIVTTLSIQIDGDMHMEIQKSNPKASNILNNEDNLEYQKIQKSLKNVKELNNLNSDIYTVVVNKNEPTKTFFAISSANTPYFRHKYPSDHLNELVKNYKDIYIFNPYIDKNGHWISAIAPIKNSKGEIVAIVEADTNFDEFIAVSKEKAINELITSISIISIALLIIILILNYMLNTVNKQQKGVLEEFSKLEEVSNHIKTFLENIVSGNFSNINESFKGDDNEIYTSLIETQEKVADNAKNEKNQQWLLEGRGKVADILQKFNKVDELGFEILKFIVEYSNAVQGGFYIKSEKEEYQMISRYAYGRKKYKYNSFKVGHGLIGQSVFEKDIIYRTEIPDDFSSITSGLITDKKPSSILIVPVLNNNEVLGVIEIAAIQKLTEIEIEFIKQVANITAQTVFNIQTNERTNKFLDDALQMGSELQEQKTTLEQNAEEMKATQEELERSNIKLEEQFKEVENQQNRLNALLSQSAEIISIYDPKMIVKYKSPSVEHILGYSPNELIGKNDFKLKGDDSLIVVTEMFKKLMDDPRQIQTVEYKSKRKDNSEVWLEATGHNMLNDNSIKGIIVSTRDITARREAEKEQEMRAKMQALSENSQDIIIRFDLEGNFLYVNSRLRHYTGILAKFTGLNNKESGVNPDIIKRWDKIIMDMKKDPKLIQREMFFETEVDQFIMQVNAIPEFNKNEELDSVLLVSHDITSRKKQEIEIQETNKKITDSINYAKRIQNAIIPMEEDLKKEFKDFMMFYMPKDVVSGDFPWYYKKDDYIYIAAVDCTGHGVPGAMMSLIGYLLLNDIVNSEENLTPSEILLKLHKGVVQTLKQDVDGNNTSDGMDVSLLRISLNNNEIQYSGAHRPLYLLRDGEIEQFKGSPFPIGGMQYRSRNKYKNREFEYKAGDKVYFFSDGLPDQFGGNGEEKYSPQRIRQMIVTNQDKSMNELDKIFKNDLINWMGEEKQIDDVLLMGISL